MSQTELTLQAAYNAPDPGIYQGVTFEEYIKWPYVNNSSLTHALRSMAHYRQNLDGPVVPQSDAMLFGVLSHLGAFEPLRLAECFAVMPDYAAELLVDYKIPRASKLYKEKVAAFTEANSGKTVVDEAVYRRMVEMVTSLWENTRACIYFNHNADIEVSIVWDDRETELRCKARLDVCDRYMKRIVDLKTTIDASVFEKSIGRYHYYRQGAFNLDGIYAATKDTYSFHLVAVEKEAPYGVRSGMLSYEAIVAGRMEFRPLLRKIAAARESDDWPGYEDPDEWRLPAWAQFAAESQGT